MASPSPAVAQGAGPNPIQNKPQTKLSPIPQGTRIRTRPLPGPSPSARPRANHPATSAIFSTPDLDGYTPPPLAPHTAVIKVSSSANFRSLVRRVRKALEKAPSSASQQSGGRGLPLAARIDALKAGTTGLRRGREGIVADALDDVVLVATGKAIERAVDVGGFFTREKDLVVLVRTRTVRAVDDVVVVDEDEDVEDQTRVRCVSCVEVGIRWAL